VALVPIADSPLNAVEKAVGDTLERQSREGLQENTRKKVQLSIHGNASEVQ